MKPRVSNAVVVLAGIAGFVLGFVAFFGLVAMVPQLFTQHLMPPNGDEVAFSKGELYYFVALSAGAVLGFIVVLRRRMHPALRAFLIALSAVLLGLFCLCDIFAVPQIINSRY